MAIRPYRATEILFQRTPLMVLGISKCKLSHINEFHTYDTHQECCQNRKRNELFFIPIVRFVVLLLLTFGLLLGCRANSSLPIMRDWETGQTEVKLMVQTHE